MHDYGSMNMKLSWVTEGNMKKTLSL